MKRPGKVVLILLLIVVLAVAAAVVYVITNLDYIVERVIEQQGSRVTKTEVSVEGVDIGLRQGSASIAGIRIANPPGFENATAFSLGEISTAIDLKSLTASPIIIEHVTVKAPAVNFELNADRRINLNELKKNLPAGRADQAPAEAAPAEAAQPKLLIRRVTLSEGIITARLAPVAEETRQLKLPPIEFTDLGAPDGATPAELTRQIVDKLIARARQAIQEQGWAQQLEEYKQQAGQRLEQEKQKLDQKKQKLESEADQKLEQEKQKAEDKLKNLLGQ